MTEGRRPLDLLAAGAAFLLPVAFSSAFNAPYWTLRSAQLLVVAAVGVPLLVVLAWRRDLAAMFAVAFLGVAGLATVVARHPLLALVGNYGFAPSLLFVAALLDVWAVGRFVSDSGRGLVVNCFLGGLLLNVGVAIGQATIDMRLLYLEGYRGSHGLLGNPVQMGALISGSVPLLAEKAVHRFLPWMVPTVATGIALQFSGSRLGLLAVVFITGYLFRIFPAKRLAPFVALLVLAFVGASLLQPALRGTKDEEATTVVEKIEAASMSHITHRTDTWLSSLGALRERPVLGYGPGRYIEATSPFRTERIAKGDPETLFFDSHNLFIEYLVGTGPLGGALLLAFVATALLRAQGPLAIAFVGIVVVQLAEPQSPATTPLAFLALGMGARKPVMVLSRSRARVASTVVLAGGGAAAAILLLVGDFRLKQADLDFSVAQAESAVELLPPWPTPMSKLGQIHIYQAKLQREDRSVADPAYERAMVSFGRAARRDPELAAHWNNLGNVALSENDFQRASPAFRMALKKNPWSATAMVGLAYVARQEGDATEAALLLRRARLVVSDPERIDALLAVTGED